MYRRRFAAVYAALAAVAVAAAAAAFLEPGRTIAPAPCRASAPTIAAALYSAAYCRVGKANVAQIGWMPHIEATGYPSRTLDEVAIVDRDGLSTYWLARVEILPLVSHVTSLTPCGDAC